MPNRTRCRACGQIKRTVYSLRCDFCRARFKAQRSDARFCSTNCRVKSHRWAQR